MPTSRKRCSKPRERRAIFKNIGKQQATTIFNTWSQEEKTNKDNCWVNSNVTKDAYIRAKSTLLNGEASRHLLHLIAWAVTHNRDPIPGLDISHLCHVKHCFNPEHLVAEARSINNQRKGCPGLLCCPLHTDIITTSLCLHKPQCMTPVRPSVRCFCPGTQTGDSTRNGFAAIDSPLNQEQENPENTFTGPLGNKELDEEEEWEISTILGSRIYRGNLQYQVLWKESGLDLQ
ncbi:zinc-binding loop region of homing endonuclease-domain-containing protein [Cercophora samala]|uniref:Zinc-binding loop region of homing endonuclease-domain-containing protein n=1 Tax=Cercophora samala TaxID=330535 RepID=A0AA39ZAA3_9PEZI|nr:zinc-binding loop region of homing endonuclease-domain-containing protein [Cercophora samala]